MYFVFCLLLLFLLSVSVCGCLLVVSCYFCGVLFNLFFFCLFNVCFVCVLLFFLVFCGVFLMFVLFVCLLLF